MKTTFLKTPVEPELMARFMAFCAAKELSPSVAIRQIISKLLKQAGQEIPDYDPQSERRKDYAQWARKRALGEGRAGVNPTIIVRVTPGMKEAFEVYATDRGLKAPAMLKRLVLKVVENIKLTEEDAAAIKLPEVRSERFTVRFSKKETEYFVPMAEEFGGIRDWLVALARSRIKADMPLFSKNEVKALYESNRELWAVGRNINQIAHAMNQDLKQAGRLEGSLARVKELDALKALIDGHTRRVMDLCNASLNRWGDG